MLRGVPDYGLDPKFIGPAAIALAQRYNLDNRDEGASERMEVLSEHEGIWGCTFVGECTKVCPKNVDPAGAIQRYKLTAALESMKSFFMPRGAHEPDRTPTRGTIRAGCGGRCPPTGGWSSGPISASSCASSCMFVAWFVVYLLLLIDAVGQGPAATRVSRLVGQPVVLSLNVVSFLFIVFHAVTFFEAAPQAMVVHVGRKRVPGGLVMAGHYLALGWRPRRSSPGCCGVAHDDQTTPEPLLWMLFSAGGVLSAMLMPILVFLFGIAFPLGWLAPPSHEQMLRVLTNPLTRARAVRALHAVVVSLGAPVPPHALRRPADQAPERGDRTRVLRLRVVGTMAVAI